MLIFRIFTQVWGVMINLGDLPTSESMAMASPFQSLSEELILMILDEVADLLANRERLFTETLGPSFLTAITVQRLPGFASAMSPHDPAVISKSLLAFSEG